MTENQAITATEMGQETIGSPVNSHNGWDPLEEIIVGSAKGARVPRADLSVYTVHFNGYPSASAIPSGPYPEAAVEKTEEELNELCAVLRKMGVTVRRPDPVDAKAVIATPDWETDGFYEYCPRDSILVAGDLLIDVPLPTRAHRLKALSFRSLELEYFRKGARWIAAPVPRLLDESFDPGRPDGYRLLDHEPCFDAANIVRLGTDYLYYRSDSGNESGAKWLQSALGSRYKVHVCSDLNVSDHIDTTIVPLRPGLVLLNPERLNEANLPAYFRNWDKIWCADIVDTAIEGTNSYSSKWIGMNILSVRPDLVIADRRQKGLIKALESKRIEVIPLQLTYDRMIGGGFHCATMDIRRKGGLECYR